MAPSRKSLTNRWGDGVLPRLLHGHHPVKEFAREMCCRQFIVDSSSIAGSPAHFAELSRNSPRIEPRRYLCPRAKWRFSAP